ncbi:hypothetical protein CRENBAI_020068 [Crenichthys baileyi]|uniref:Uncharacterized protein n=1 Tax=Crenichthys baileyi TaxID=28760 RepID=A0AAV9RQH2_9TELE
MEGGRFKPCFSAGDLDTVTTQLEQQLWRRDPAWTYILPLANEKKSTADGQIIFFPFAKEAKGRRLTALPEVNRGRMLTSNFPPPPFPLTLAALKNCSKRARRQDVKHGDPWSQCPVTEEGKDLQVNSTSSTSCHL